MVRFKKAPKKMALAAVTMAAVTAAVVAMPSTALADDSGTCGPNGGVKWVITDSNDVTLSPSGNGEAILDQSGWYYGYAQNIRSIKIEKGVIAPASLEDFFADLHNAVTIDASGLDTSQVTDIDSTFINDENLTTLNVSGWDVSKVTRVYRTFAYCTSLQTIYSNTNWSANDHIYANENMFLNCFSLKGGAGTVFDPEATSGDLAKIDGVSSDGVHSETRGYFTDSTPQPTATTTTVTSNSVKGTVYKIKAKKGSKVKLPYAKGVKYKLAKKSKLFKVSKKGVVKSLKKLKKGKTYKIKVKMTQGKKTQKVTVKIKVIK